MLYQRKEVATMDVERIQKVNNLALDLMRQGLATDREDAVNQAEKIFRLRDTDDYSTVRQTMKEMEPKSVAEPTEELTQETIKSILQQNTTFVVKKFKEFQEKVEALEKEIAEVRTKLTYQRLPRAEDVIQERQQDVTVKQAVTVPPPQGGHPRSGSYSTEDVSIEKFFYMGSK